jgi:hypothetical protein
LVLENVMLYWTGKQFDQQPILRFVILGHWGTRFKNINFLPPWFRNRSWVWSLRMKVRKRRSIDDSISS